MPFLQSVTGPAWRRAAVAVGAMAIGLGSLISASSPVAAAGSFTYYFLWYDHESSPGFVNDNIHVYNPGNVSANVTVAIPGTPGCNFSDSLNAGQEKFYGCPTGFGGPVVVTGDHQLKVSQRVQFYQSFNEVPASPDPAGNTFFKHLQFAWYDHISDPGFLADNIHVFNPSAGSASVTVHIPGLPDCNFTGTMVAAHTEHVFSCPTGYGGPVTVDSDTAILASQRVEFYRTFNEVLASKVGDAGTSWEFTWFDKVSSPGFKNDNVHIWVPGTTDANVAVDIPGCAEQDALITAGTEQFFSCGTGFGGPVTVTSDQPVLSSQRVQFYQSFNEVPAMNPASAATSLALLWYDKISSPGFLTDNIHITNPSTTTTANVTVSIPGCADQMVAVNPSSEQFVNCSTGFGGPVLVTSDSPVLASQRVEFYQTFNEVIAS